MCGVADVWITQSFFQFHIVICVVLSCTISFFVTHRPNTLYGQCMYISTHWASITLYLSYLLFVHNQWLDILQHSTEQHSTTTLIHSPLVIYLHLIIIIHTFNHSHIMKTCFIDRMQYKTTNDSSSCTYCVLISVLQLVLCINENPPLHADSFIISYYYYDYSVCIIFLFIVCIIITI